MSEQYSTAKDTLDVIQILKEAKRSGADTDEPEGSRTVTFSVTLVGIMINALLNDRAKLVGMKS